MVFRRKMDSQTSQSSSIQTNDTPGMLSWGVVLYTPWEKLFYNHGGKGTGIGPAAEGRVPCVPRLTGDT